MAPVARRHLMVGASGARSRASARRRARRIRWFMLTLLVSVGHAPGRCNAAGALCVCAQRDLTFREAVKTLATNSSYLQRVVIMNSIWHMPCPTKGVKNARQGERRSGNR